jgi:hypothetical protein
VIARSRPSIAGPPMPGIPPAIPPAAPRSPAGLPSPEAGPCTRHGKSSQAIDLVVSPSQHFGEGQDRASVMGKIELFQIVMDYIYLING